MLTMVAIAAIAVLVLIVTYANLLDEKRRTEEKREEDRIALVQRITEEAAAKLADASCSELERAQAAINKRYDILSFEYGTDEVSKVVIEDARHQELRAIEMLYGNPSDNS